LHFSRSSPSSPCSVDGRMLLNTTVWGDGTVNTIVIRPDRLPSETK
jgi:hypothetical protein